MIVEVMFDNGITCAQEFSNISTRSYYIPDITIDTKCRHSFDVSKLNLDRLDSNSCVELIKEVESRNIKTLNCIISVIAQIDSKSIHEAKHNIDKFYFPKGPSLSRPYGQMYQVKILSYDTYDDEVIDCCDLTFSKVLANSLTNSRRAPILQTSDGKKLTLDSSVLCMQVFN